jgi:uncharacterized protein
MSCNQSVRAVSFVSFLIIATTLVGFTQPRVSYVVDPDIPRVQAGSDGGAISREIELGSAFLAGRGVPRDEKQAAYWYEKAANSGDPAAQEEIGYFYQAGIGVERDPARAARWFERAVAGGLISAKVNLGVAYVWGLGVRKDPVFAVQLFREAAKKGSGMGACYLGDMYYFGVGVTKNESEAKHWFEIGSKLHNVAAESDLALLLLGHPDQASQERAIQLLREASTAGSVAAKHQLGMEMIHRPALSRSPDEALKVLEEAAADGYWKSSAVLGVLSRDGKGVAKDKRAAYYHFRVATLQSQEKAATLLANDLRTLSSELDPVQVEELDQEANTWVQKHSHSLDFVNPHNDFANNFPAFALEHPQKDIHAALLLEAPEGDGIP